MNVMNALRFKIMLVMLFCLLMCIGFIFTEQFIHEILGLVFCAGVLFHLWMNRWFFKTMLKKTKSNSSLVNRFITLMLMFAFLVLFVFGLLNSKYVTSIFNTFGGSTERDLHVVAAYWSLIFVGLHVGMHWDVIKKHPILSKIVQIRFYGFKVVTPLIELGLFLLGVFAFFDREIMSKLFFSAGFEFWDKSRPQFLFYMFMLSIIIGIALLTKTISKIFSLTRRSNVNE